jgi:hypothetical protein
MVRVGEPPTTSLSIAQMLRSRGWSAFADHDNDKRVLREKTEPDDPACADHDRCWGDCCFSGRKFVQARNPLPRHCPSHQRGALRGKVPRSGGWGASAVYEFNPGGGDTCKRCSPPSVSQLCCDPPSPATRSALVGRAMIMESKLRGEIPAWSGILSVQIKMVSGPNSLVVWLWSGDLYSRPTAPARHHALISCVLHALKLTLGVPLLGIRSYRKLRRPFVSLIYLNGFASISGTATSRQCMRECKPSAVIVRIPLPQQQYSLWVGLSFLESTMPTNICRRLPVTAFRSTQEQFLTKRN